MHLCIWRSEVILWELVLVFHHVSPGNHTQVVRLGCKCPYLFTHLTGPTPALPWLCESHPICLQALVVLSLESLWPGPGIEKNGLCSWGR